MLKSPHKTCRILHTIHAKICTLSFGTGLDLWGVDGLDLSVFVGLIFGVFMGAVPQPAPSSAMKWVKTATSVAPTAVKFAGR